MSGLESWREEKQSAWLYRALAECEPDARIATLFRTLASSAEGQADKWRAESGGEPPAFAPSVRARITASLARTLGPRRIRPVLVAMKVRGVSAYDARTATPGHTMPTSVSQVGVRHKGYGGGNLRAAVFGVNDGLVSNASLIMGVAGAGAGIGGVVTSGVAGLLAGALSMAAGEYVSMRSQREMFEYQIGLERDELHEYPEEEAEELALIYNTRGMELEEARRITRELVKNHDAALDALAREELGLNPDDLGSPWGAAIFSFLAFAAGASLPLLPFLLGLPLERAVTVAAATAGIALFGVGAALSLFTGRNAWLGGLRMVAIGGGAGAVTWIIGHLLGAAIS
ncbi:MAG TPA: VIT1/CCC1 transporter family protein [Steroidobacteraceae bacterium]|nr:VIT1/CCC1 transporter family protein [Steroidobacteraceae bacterium]HQR48034.1 VIT1/CCC1 transporter family protein [Steroidobacteraceae bacterium]